MTKAAIGEITTKLILRQEPLKKGLKVWVKSPPEQDLSLQISNKNEWEKVEIFAVSRNRWVNILREGETRPTCSRQLVRGGRWFVSSNQDTVENRKEIQQELEDIFESSQSPYHPTITQASQEENPTVSEEYFMDDA